MEIAYFKDYMPIPKDVEKIIKVDCRKVNTTVVLTSRASRHPEDGYLFVVLAKKKIPLSADRPYVVWYFNASIGGLSNGAYDLSFPDALSAMASKIR